jgi:ABC-2 type transport system ATP-binding protein
MRSRLDPPEDQTTTASRMINVQSLTRHYGIMPAVDDVSFHIGKNEVVGLLGHNGAGKTTIMRMLSGYLEPSAGSIIVDGVDLATDPHIIQQQLGYLPENLPVYPDMMVADYLEYVATLKGIARQDRYQVVREALVDTDLMQQALDPINTLSRGFKQRVGVAQAILGEPRLLILDEPTNGLDPRQTAHMRRLIKRMAQTATVILSTHIMQEVEAVCDRVLMLRNGRLALDERLDDLRHSKTLLLGTGDSVASLASFLRRLPQVSSLQQTSEESGTMHFILQLHSHADMATAANNIAQCVIAAGASLYHLRPQVRDLDSVFRTVNPDGD